MSTSQIKLYEQILVGNQSNIRVNLKKIGSEVDVSEVTDKTKEMLKDPYVSSCWDKAAEYIRAVQDGSIVVNENIKLAVKRFWDDKNRSDIVYNVNAITKVFRFFSYLYVEEGKQFVLEPFQCFIITALFGPYFKGTDIRKYLYAFLFLGRKNGKTTFVSALQLYFMIADSQSYPRSILISASQANTRDTSFAALEEIIKWSPALNQRLEVMKSNVVRFKEVNGDRKLGWCKTTVMDMKKLEGYNPTSCILDEIHTYKDSQKFNVIKNGLGTKKNPMLFLISTGGYGTDTFCTQLVETGRNVLRGLAQDDRFFYMLYELDEGDDWEDEKNWYKANPGLGTILDYQVFKDDFNTSKLIPSLLRDFQTKRLNMFLEENSQIVEERVLISAFQKFSDDDVKDLPCYLGCDLSETRDLTSIVALWDGGEKIYVKSWFFFVENENNNALRKGGVDIHRWIQQGYVIPCDGGTIDYALVKKYFFDLKKKFKVKALYYDPWHFRMIYNTPTGSKGFSLRSDEGQDSLWCVPVKPGTPTQDWPIRYIQGAFYDSKVIIYPNKCMLWNIKNAVIESSKDVNGNMRLNKKESKDAVDGFASLLNALYGYLGINSTAASNFINSL